MGFKQKVCDAVKKVPKGKVTTYKEIADYLDSRAYQAIGNILAKNEHGYLQGGNIPCHRVVRSDGEVGGFCGQKCGKMVCEKKKLLRGEGIRFRGNKIIDFEKKLYKFKK